MSQTLIKWACPMCRSSLNSDLSCSRCEFVGYKKNEMTYLHRDDDSWGRCIVERDGWINRTKEICLYVENSDHFFLPDRRPHLKEVYTESKTHIDAFQRVEDLNDKICLDLGASVGWVEPYVLATHPMATLIALEVNDDPLCGLGRSQALKRHYGIDFVSLVADMHHIPILEGTVDFVFSVDALHHFRDLKAVFAEVARVLKPGGRFYGLNEPDRPEGTDESEYITPFAEIEMRHNIIERRPTRHEYETSGSELKLRAANQELGLIQHVDTASLILVGEKRRP
jgi:SAM-dependent methyltransferase